MAQAQRVSPVDGVGGAAGRVRRFLPPPALCGFLLLLALVFGGSYAVGSALGPVSPGMHDTDPGSGGDGTVPGDGGTAPGGGDTGTGDGGHEGHGADMGGMRG